MIIALFRHVHVFGWVHRKLIGFRNILSVFSLLLATSNFARCEFSDLLLLCNPLLSFERINVSDVCSINAICYRSHLVLHALKLRSFLLFLLFFNIFVEVLVVDGSFLRFFSGRLLLGWISLSLVLGLHFLLILLDDVKEVLRHQHLISESVQ